MRLSDLDFGPPVIPVVALDDAASALPLADALLEGGIRVIEITLRTPAALDAAERLARARPEICLGIGTVLTAQDLRVAHAAGARFTVSPGATPALLEAAGAAPVPHLPGCQTVSDAMAAQEAGMRDIKLFPATLSGGTGMIGALAQVLPGLRICPTGGVKEETLADFLARPNVFAVGGTWLTPKTLIEAGRFRDITALAKQAVEIATGVDRA